MCTEYKTFKDECCPGSSEHKNSYMIEAMDYVTCVSSVRIHLEGVNNKVHRMDCDW